MGVHNESSRLGGASRLPIEAYSMTAADRDNISNNLLNRALPLIRLREHKGAAYLSIYNLGDKAEDIVTVLGNSC